MADEKAPIASEEDTSKSSREADGLRPKVVDRFGGRTLDDGKDVFSANAW